MIKNIFKALALVFIPLAGWLAVSLASGIPAMAQTPSEELCRGSGGTPTGTGADFECVRAGETGLFANGGIFRNIVNVLIFLVGVISVIMLIVGAIRFTTSGGDANAVTGARNTILYSIVGIIVAATAFALVNFVINSLVN